MECLDDEICHTVRMTYMAKFEIMSKVMPDLVVMDPHQPVSDHMNRSHHGT